MTNRRDRDRERLARRWLVALASVAVLLTAMAAYRAVSGSGGGSDWGTFPHQSFALISWGGTDYYDPGETGLENIDNIVDMGAKNLDVQIHNGIDTDDDTVENDLEDSDQVADYERAIDYAKSKGLKVTIKPHSGTLQNRDYYPDDPEKFWDSYESMLMDSARLAARKGAYMLVIGTELGGKLSSNEFGSYDNCGRWRNMIASVRDTAPGVKLTYAATISSRYDSLQANEATRVCFWDRLDYVGFDAYPDMNGIDTNATADDFHDRMFDNDRSLDDVDDDGTADPIFALSRFQELYGVSDQDQVKYSKFVLDGIRRKTRRPDLKVIYTEFGGASNETIFEYWGTAEGDPVDLSAQRNAWEGALRALEGNDWLEGIVVWQVLPFHEPSDTDDDTWRAEYDPTHKPAQTVICRYFSAGNDRDCPQF